MLTAGVDIGAQSAKAVILSGGQISGYSILLTGRDVTSAGEDVMEEALKKAGVSRGELSYIVATGYGRRAFPWATETITEITCHAAGASWLLPTTRTVVDIGGQDSKVIRVDEKGDVVNFIMNDKCAAGTGRFLEVMAMALDLELEHLGPLSLTSSHPCKMTSICTVFAESEVVSLRAEKKSIEDIIAGIHRSISRRIVNMGAQVGFRDSVVFSGGVAKNIGVKKVLEDELQLQIIVPEEPQIVGALGAALLAAQRRLAQ